MFLRRNLLLVTALALAAVVLMTAMPDASQAIPAFSRQTGEGCLKCHFLTFPALNDYGRDFKRRAYTFVREEALVERNGTLSIPVVLNASLVLNAKYTNSTTTGVAPAAVGYTNGTWDMPYESPILVAGRLGRMWASSVRSAKWMAPRPMASLRRTGKWSLRLRCGVLG